ncbi:UNVERIFIED_CONTAM: hypothetical protein GTU68_020247, partial [Idotea baltica]|nr:hypothetical protein [Idotea baltica]
MMQQLGGRVESGTSREFGRAFIEKVSDDGLFAGLFEGDNSEQVWMSHGDHVAEMAPGFGVIAKSPGAPYAVIADPERDYYGTQFHPEVVHTSHGSKMLRNFTHGIAGLKGDWTMAAYRGEAIQKIRDLFIDVFEAEAKKIGGADFLAQGTLYPDVIESVSAIGGPSVTIKSHHNVGGLPERMNMQLVEPLRDLFKDEVRALGRELGLPDAFVGRHPFPGPGLAIRIPGEITRNKADTLRKADAIYIEEIKAAGLYDEIWQAFSVLLPVNTVGVMGDERTYEAVLALRAVTSTDGMTADYYPYEHEFLGRVATRIINEVKGVNRVV